MGIPVTSPPPNRDSPGVVVPPPLIFLSALVVGVVADHLVVPSTTWVPPAPRYILASVMTTAGAALIGIALGYFWGAGTRPEPWQPTSKLVLGGIYRYSRNPMYLGMALAYAGGALLVDSLIALVLLAPVVAVIHREVIGREERYLELKFGNEFLNYKAQVRPWI